MITPLRRGCHNVDSRILHHKPAAYLRALFNQEPADILVSARAASRMGSRSISGSQSAIENPVAGEKIIEAMTTISRKTLCIICSRFEFPVLHYSRIVIKRCGENVAHKWKSVDFYQREAELKIGKKRQLLLRRETDTALVDLNHQHVII
jgi:hypothetical protein